MLQEVLKEPGWMERMESEDLRALTPLIYSHVNTYGLFRLNMAERLPLEFVAAIREDRPPLVSGLDGYRALQVVLAAYESAQSGQPVHLANA
jgi:Oxidoreductase family, C-terminal alpha/beta domain